MNKKEENLVEGQYGHGAIAPSKLRIKLRRLFRVRNNKHKVGSAAPINWNKPRKNIVIPIKNQYASSSCGGQMTAYMVELMTGITCSAKSFYSQYFYPGGGMDESVIRNKINTNGINQEKDVSSYKSDGTTDEPFMTDTSWRTDTLSYDALKRSGYVAINVPLTMEGIAGAVDTYGAVGVLLHGQNNGTWLTPNPLPPTSNDNIWTHYMAFCDYFFQDRNKCIALQSWGSSVGDKGFQYFDEKYITSGYVLDAFALIKQILFTQQMGYGSVGTQVYILQKRLIQENVASFKVPLGIFGPLTQLAVKLYQARYGIPQTGFVGPLTLEQLNKTI